MWVAVVTALALAAGVAAMLITMHLASAPEDASPRAAAPPPPVAPPTLAPAAPVADPPARETVTITVTGAPPSTEVLLAGTVVGVAPGPVQLPRGTEPLVLTFTVAGFRPVSHTITPDRDQALALKLARKPVAPPAAKRPTRDDIPDEDELFAPARKP